MPFFVYTVSKTHPGLNIQRDEFDTESAHFYLTKKGRRVAKESQYVTHTKSFEDALNLQSRYLQIELKRAKDRVASVIRDIERMPKLINPKEEDYIPYIKERI